MHICAGQCKGRRLSAGTEEHTRPLRLTLCMAATIIIQLHPKARDFEARIIPGISHGGRLQGLPRRERTGAVPLRMNHSEHAHASPPPGGSFP